MHVANEESPTRGAPKVMTSTLIFLFNAFVNSAVSFAHSVAREPPSEWPVTRTSSKESSDSHLSWISVFISSQVERNCLLKPRCTWTFKNIFFYSKFELGFMGKISDAMVENNRQANSLLQTIIHILQTFSGSSQTHSSLESRSMSRSECLIFVLACLYPKDLLIHPNASPTFFQTSSIFTSVPRHAMISFKMRIIWDFNLKTRKFTD